MQVCLNDLPATLWQAEGAAAWLRRLLWSLLARRPHVGDEAFHRARLRSGREGLWGERDDERWSA